MGGKYFAEIVKVGTFVRSQLRYCKANQQRRVGASKMLKVLKEFAVDLESTKYQSAELRFSVYGKSADEWEKLAKWALHYNVYSDNILWLVQIPRL